MSITRFKLTIHLKTQSPLHSGGVDVAVDPTREGSDREAVATRFVRDAHERPILTGRSVKGALRAACARYLEENPKSAVAQVLTKDVQAGLWGDRGKNSPNGTPLRASALTFHSVEIPQTALVGPEPDESSNTERRETGSGDQSRGPALPRRVGIAMNRYWGAVGDGALFEHEFVPGRTELTLVITAEGADGGAPEKPMKGEDGADDVSKAKGPATPPRSATAAEVKALLGLIVGLFQAGRVCFGGRQGAGWGRVELDNANPVEFREFALSNRADLKALLNPTDCDSSSSGTRLTPTACGPSARTRITITWNSPTGILVADPGLSQQDKAQRKKEREAALAEGRDFDEKPVPIGPLRDNGTVSGSLVLPGSSVRGALRARASRIARTVLVGALGQKLDDWSEPEVHNQLAADPSLVRDLFGTTERRGALSVLDTLASSSGTSRTVTHNAGDRWTGGVAEGALYSEEVYDVEWDAITLELDPNRLPADDSRRRAAWCLLGLVLAELATGTLPLGSRGTRGLGQVEVKGITVTGLEWLGLPDGGTKSFTAGAGRSGSDVAEALLEHLKAVNTMAAGWSSYLIDVEEKHNG